MGIKKVIIMAGGMGARLRPFSFIIPKPLIPVGEEPILWHLIQSLKKSGFSEFLLAVGYHADLIMAYCGDGSRFGVSIKYFHESKPLGTAGPLRLMRNEFEENEYFLLVNGDIYTEIDYSRMILFAEQAHHDIVVAYVQKKEQSRYGILTVKGDKLNQIIEKPKRDYSINAGIYIVNSRVLAEIPDDSFFTMVHLAQKHLLEGRPVGVHRVDQYWIGIEDIDGLNEVTERLLKRNRPEVT